jgi:hypothetical protein
MQDIKVDEALWASNMLPEGIVERWFIADGAIVALHEIMAPVSGRLTIGDRVDQDGARSRFSSAIEWINHSWPAVQGEERPIALLSIGRTTNVRSPVVCKLAIGNGERSGDAIAQPGLLHGAYLQYPVGRL